MFLAGHNNLDDLTLEELDDDVEEAKFAASAANEGDVDAEEVKNNEDSGEEEAFVYDRALYDADGLEDEDVDFDDDEE